MKKLMSVLILFAMLLSLCACGAEDSTPDTTGTTQAPETTAPVEETKGESSGVHELTNEDLYGHINQLEPVGGVYQIWSEVGVQNMADHPDADFELLCSVDMKGATVRPIGTAEKPFTGKLRGSDFAISNFTVEGGDEESFGFVGVNQGQIRNLILNNVTFVPGEKAKYIGSFAGKNEGTIIRSIINTGAMTVEKAPEGAVCGSIVGLNTGSITNTRTDVDLAYNAEAAATVGGIAGVATGGEIAKVELSGKLEVAGDNKTVGLFAGSADVVITDCAFLGEKNTVSGQLYESFTGNEDDEMVTVTGALLRDNGREELPENIRALRNKVVKAMNDMCSIEWKVKEDLPYSDRVWSTTYTFQGIPYNHKSSSLAQAMYIIGDDGYLEDWAYGGDVTDSWDNYFGTDCSSMVQQAWWTVSNSTDTFVCRWMVEDAGQGGIGVGPYDATIPMDYTTPLTDVYINAHDDQTIYESYAAMRAGDAYMYCKETGGHTRLASADPVVIRDQNGLIDPQRSYVLSSEQGHYTRDDVTMTYSSCRVDYKYYFANLYFDWAIPMTCKELLTGEVDPVEAYVDGAIEGYAGLITGEVRANYNLDYVVVQITDSKGEAVLDHILWVDVQKNKEYANQYFAGRVLNERYDLANVAVLLANTDFVRGETYHYTITAGLSTFDKIPVHEGSFTYGAQ